MPNEYCVYLLPGFSYLADFAIMDGQCLLAADHGADNHLVCTNNPITGPDYIVWTPDRENDDGSEDYQDFIYGHISEEEAHELIRQSWAQDAGAILEELKKSITP